MRLLSSSSALVLIVLAAFVCSANSLAGLSVKGNKIYDSTGKNIKLKGVNRSGAEFACVQGHGIFDGPMDQGSINNMKSWKGVNIVRVPLNEDCWLAINGVQPSMGGQVYQKAIGDYIKLLNDNGLYVIIDLHWTAAGSTLATKQDPMPNRDHSIEFWKSAANYFKGNNAVIFDLFNEPYPDNNNFDSTNGWTCWRSGSNCNYGFQVAGMQDLVSAVRSTGASNILMAGGLAYSNSLTQWARYAPNDTLNALAASWHSYNFNYCNNQNCWNQYVLPVARKYPVIIGEMGENDCAHGYVDSLMSWADQNEVAGYLGWTWNTWNCNDGPALISDYSGNPTNFGVGIKNHFAASSN